MSSFITVFILLWTLLLACSKGNGNDNSCFSMHLVRISPDDSDVDGNVNCFEYKGSKSNECNDDQFEFDPSPTTDESSQHNGRYSELIMRVNNTDCPDVDIHHINDLIVGDQGNVMVVPLDEMKNEKYGIKVNFEGDTFDFKLCLKGVNQTKHGIIVFNHWLQGNSKYHQNEIYNGLPDFCGPRMGVTNSNSYHHRKLLTVYYRCFTRKKCRGPVAGVYTDWTVCCPPIAPENWGYNKKVGGNPPLFGGDCHECPKDNPSTEPTIEPTTEPTTEPIMESDEVNNALISPQNTNVEYAKNMPIHNKVSDSNVISIVIVLIIISIISLSIVICTIHRKRGKKEDINSVSSGNQIDFNEKAQLM